MILVMWLASYTLTVSLVYAFVYAMWPEAANGSVVFFVALLLGPACVAEHKRAKRAKRRQERGD